MRLIDADALKYKNLAEVNGRLTYVLTAEEIDNAPPVKGEILTKEAYSDLCLRASHERPQGEWFLVGHNDTVNFYKCSICGYEEHDNFTKHYYFCPNCGADMRGDINA